MGELAQRKRVVVLETHRLPPCSKGDSRHQKDSTGRVAVRKGGMIIVSLPAEWEMRDDGDGRDGNAGEER